MKIAIVDYGASNLQSVANALTSLGQTFEVVSDPKELRGFDKVIVPGVGAAGSAMKKLRESGFADVLPTLKIPVLGLCLGMQMLAEFSEEDSTKCLSILSGKVRRFVTDLKIPPLREFRIAPEPRRWRGELYRVPPHVRDFELGHEAADFSGKNREALRRVFFAELRKHLHAETKPQHGDFERG